MRRETPRRRPRAHCAAHSERLPSRAGARRKGRRAPGLGEDTLPLLIDPAIAARVERLEIPFNSFGVDPYGVSKEHVARFLSRMWECLKPGGRIAIMGPNYRYCAREYWDCADHTLALTHVAVGEHLYTAGFDVRQVVPRFLPYSFRGRFPASSALTGLYLRMRLAWPMFGKQFFLVGQRPADVPALAAASRAG